MGDVHQKYDAFLETLLEWALQTEDIRGVIVIGSRARQQTPADEWSDLDLALVTTDPDKYLSGTEWLKPLGEYWLTFVENTAAGDGKERRVLFADAVDVDFAILPANMLQHVLDEPAVQRVLKRGAAVLVDKDQLLGTLMNAGSNSALEAELPSEAEWIELIHDFLYHAVWSAKKLLRGECWTAKMAIDGYMKWNMLKMAEWHASVMYGQAHDTWHAGRFFDQWAAPFVKERMKACFAAYDLQDLRRALDQSMQLFRQMATEVAEQLDYPYPSQADHQVTAWLTRQWEQ